MDFLCVVFDEGRVVENLMTITLRIIEKWNVAHKLFQLANEESWIQKLTASFFSPLKKSLIRTKGKGGVGLEGRVDMQIIEIGDNCNIPRKKIEISVDATGRMFKSTAWWQNTCQSSNGWLVCCLKAGSVCQWRIETVGN